MTPDLEKELKAQYFAVYFGQNVFSQKGLQLNQINFKKAINNSDSILLLRRIYNVNDVEALQLYMLYNQNNSNTREKSLENGRKLIRRLDSTLMSHDISNNILDYLRSIGVATPFRGYTVEQFISMGWIKIISS